MEPRLYENA